jgi:hypothetical protein
MVALDGLLEPEAGQTLLAALASLAARPTPPMSAVPANATPTPSPSWRAAPWKAASCPTPVGSGPS